jgi:hypothetical protein
VADGFAALTGWLLGAVVLSVALALGLTGLWAPAALLGHGGLLLWAWATCRQHASLERSD